MMNDVVRRLGLLVAVVLATTFLAFAALNLLGDPLVNVVGSAAELPCDVIEETGAMPDGLPATPSTTSSYAAVAAASAIYHLDKPLPTRYLLWLGDVLRGDFGRSFANDQAVSDIIIEKAPETLLLMAMALVLSLAISIPWGVAAAYRAHRRLDRASTVVSFGLLAIPNFALGVLLLYFFALRWEVFPSAYDASSFGSQVWSLVLPATALALPLAAGYQRLLRSDLITTLQEDFVHMARAKGMPPRYIMFRHALRPSLFSLLTVFGVNMGTLIGGSLIVERIFAIPGLGSEIVTAVIRDDFPTVLGMVVVLSIAFVVINFVVDLLYRWLDPRVSIS